MSDLSLLSFPRGIGTKTHPSSQPYMFFTSYESKNAIESTGQTGHASGANAGIAKSYIALYIPPNALKTEFKAEYGGKEGAATKAAAGAAIGRMATEGLGATLLAGLKGAGLSIGGAALKAAENKTGMLAAQGIAVNNHMALTYKGPSQFRSHDFAFSFFPKNGAEADELQKILEDFENGMLPRMGGGAEKIAGRKLSQPLFRSPRHWTIDFFTRKGQKNDYLFQIKKSVITSMSVNHDPSSTVSLHNKDEKTGRGEGSPVQTTLTLSFQEIELPISNDKTIKVEE